MIQHDQLPKINQKIDYDWKLQATLKIIKMDVFSWIDPQHVQPCPLETDFTILYPMDLGLEVRVSVRPQGPQGPQGPQTWPSLELRDAAFCRALAKFNRSWSLFVGSSVNKDHYDHSCSFFLWESSHGWSMLIIDGSAYSFFHSSSMPYLSWHQPEVESAWTKTPRVSSTSIKWTEIRLNLPSTKTYNIWLWLT